MSKFPYSISGRSITFYVSGQPYSLDRSAPGYAELKALVQTNDPDVDKCIALTNPITAIASAVETAIAADYLPRGVVGVTRNTITYNGEPLHGVLIDRIFDVMADGFDVMPWVRFVENLMMNPADFARDELYLWLENSDLPITEDGHFLAYKMVRSDFTSLHGGEVDNTPGTIVSMPRQDVDPIRDHLCSTGLHFCSKSYLPAAYDTSSGNPIVLLKVNPADVVSIPSDYGNSKGRAWKYEVLQTVDFDMERKWSAVYVDDEQPVDDGGSDGDEQPTLVFPSELAGALFAAITDIGVDVQDRDERINWANWTLYMLVEDFFSKDFIESFKDLTIEQAQLLIDYAREEKEVQDAEVEESATEAAEDAAEALAHAEQARIDAINSYGIQTLRSKASHAGMPGAWKGPKAAELRAYLINHASKPV